MSIGTERSGNGPPDAINDRKLCTPTRFVAGTPFGVLTPAFAGEMVQDNTTFIRYTACGLTNATWQRVA